VSSSHVSLESGSAAFVNEASVDCPESAVNEAGALFAVSALYEIVDLTSVTPVFLLTV